MDGEPREERRRVMLHKAALAAQLVSIALTIIKIVTEWILPVL